MIKSQISYKFWMGDPLKTPHIFKNNLSVLSILLKITKKLVSQAIEVN